MPDRRDESPTRREYPGIYEKAVPIAQPGLESTASAQGAPS
jgi:hypothetical protein